MQHRLFFFFFFFFVVPDPPSSVAGGEGGAVAEAGPMRPATRSCSDQELEAPEHHEDVVTCLVGRD